MSVAFSWKLKGGPPCPPKKNQALKMAMIKGQWVVIRPAFFPKGVRRHFERLKFSPLKRPLPADSGDFTRIFLQGGVSLIVLKKFHQLVSSTLKSPGQNCAVDFTWQTTIAKYIYIYSSHGFHGQKKCFKMWRVQPFLPKKKSGIWTTHLFTHFSYYRGYCPLFNP